ISLWFVDMNQRVKKPGLWSAACASCASCGWRWSVSAVVLMSLLIRSAYWFVRLATFGFFAAGAGLLFAVPGVAGAGVTVSVLVPPVVGGAAAGWAPGMWPPLCATQAANCA